MLSGLGVGLVLAILAIIVLLAANFQSFRLSLVAVSTVPAVIAGSACMLWLTGTTLNIQSFIGTITQGRNGETQNDGIDSED